MPVLYQAFQSQLKNQAGKQLYYPKVVRIGMVNTDQIAKEIAAYSSLSTGDVKNTIDNLITVMGQHLRASESVVLDGLGIFRMRMKSKGMGVELPDDVNASQSQITVGFIPASTRNSDRTLATRSMVTGAKCVRYVKPDATLPEGGGQNPDQGGDVVDPSA